MLPWISITQLADTTVMLPLAAACAAWLACARAWRMALWWCFLLALGLALVTLSKIAFIGWGIGIPTLDFTGFSGHAMRTTAVMPVLFYLLLQKSTVATRISGVILGMALGVFMGISRLAVHVHSMSEVVSGCLLGACVSIGFIWISRTFPKPVLHRWLIVLSLVVLIPAPMANPAPTERWLNTISLLISRHDKPFERGYSGKTACCGLESD
ncbi:phosphatase PAP2 family protein [Glaciimonas immobilis]|uniref:Membrane-associated phospholipid phosphatase n=1 Tax=Glaciimonas immobilis TaxID=728004 RepID=A0A840RN60_9BURK|nr:phosphatase PAP2 family protein [Glaciimonas immobilis]KAF3998166.1 phosphatase PAP2 family protein [Glaciimonas immobilis]MBB5199125.1 membrane-associated phospholipid phosphatase [Glaciimonas immobilis]